MRLCATEMRRSRRGGWNAWRHDVLFRAEQDRECGMAAARGQRVVWAAAWHGRSMAGGRRAGGTCLAPGCSAVRAARFVGRSVSKTSGHNFLTRLRATRCLANTLYLGTLVQQSVTYYRKPTRRTARVLSKVHDAPSRNPAPSSSAGTLHRPATRTRAL